MPPSCQSPALTAKQMIHNVPQPAFEQFLADQLKNDPNVTMEKGVAFVSCSQVCKLCFAAD
jgi:hypothetical protein